MTLVRALATAAFSTVLGASALAQSKAMVTYFTPAIVSKVLTDAGMKDVAARKQPVGNSETVDVVSFSSGSLKHVGILTVCSQKGCLGLQLMTIWGENAGKGISRNALNSYNADYGFGKGFVGPNNTLVYSRYTISDGGVSADNIKFNISNFAAGSQNFMQYMAKSGSGSEASLKSADDAVIHSASQVVAPEAQAVLMEIGQGSGSNVLSIQSAPVPDAPVLIKPAQ